MKYFLDTNIIIELMDNNQMVLNKLKSLWSVNDVFMSDIVLEVWN